MSLFESDRSNSLFLNPEDLQKAEKILHTIQSLNATKYQPPRKLNKGISLATNSTNGSEAANTTLDTAKPTDDSYSLEYSIGVMFLLLIIYHALDLCSNVFELVQMKDKTHMEIISIFFTLNSCYGCGLFVMLNMLFFRDLFRCEYSTLNSSMIFYWILIELSWFYASCIVSLVILAILLLQKSSYSGEFNLKKNKTRDDFYRKQVEFDD
mmetsp:Transcript_44930/g.43507  ORF Transcript_44930/g.43507 Transcript_44930/m.43507 type:complete len:210 (+) Transcript_44930:363-992(+)